MGSGLRGRWPGPPLPLIAATVIGFAVAPMVSSNEAPAGADEPAAQVQLSSGAPTSATTDDEPRTPVGQDAAVRQAERRPRTIPRQVVGVATFNQYRLLSYADAMADARALTSLPQVDIIGWQEAYNTGPVLRALGSRGWDTKRFRQGATELAVSWRRADFEFVSADQRLVARGVGDESGRYPFGDRYTIRVTLRDRGTGELISVLDTHLPQAIEDLDRPGHWRPTFNSIRARTQLTRMAAMWDRAPGRWVVGTGDYNVDVRAETRTRPQGGLTRMFAGRAVSSYAMLGEDLAPTHPSTGRLIDYVHASREDVKAGRIRFLDQRTIPGLNSDHRPLLVRLALS